MRIVYLIFSHVNPDQVLRLARALRRHSEDSYIAIHHDPSNSALETEQLRGIDRAYVVPAPIRGQWGDFSLVEQYLHALTWCRRHLDADWVVILTGQSYPLRPLGDFERQLAEAPFDAYVNPFEAMGTKEWPPGTARTRYFFRYFRLPRFAYWHRLPRGLREALRRSRQRINASQSLIRVVPMPRGAPTRLGIRRISTPFGASLKLYGGSQLMTLGRAAIEYALTFAAQNPWYTEYFRSTIIPDEVFFVTLLANNPGIRLGRDTSRFINWPRDQPDAASVAVIRREQLGEVRAGGAYFALKFDDRVDSGALDALDAA